MTKEELWDLLIDLIPLNFIEDKKRGYPFPQDLYEVADKIIDALRANNVLVEGTPTDEQVERAARAYDPEAWAAYDRVVDEVSATGESPPAQMVEYSLGKARDMLTAAAGVTPPAPSADAESWLNSPTATLHGARGAIRGLIDALASPSPVESEERKAQPTLWDQQVLAQKLYYEATGKLDWMVAPNRVRVEWNQIAKEKLLSEHINNRKG